MMAVSDDNRIQWALEKIRNLDADSAREALDVLRTADADEVEPALYELVKSDEEPEVAATASRILIERDPDRDPEFLLEKFSPRRSDEPAGLDRTLSRFERFMIGDHPFAAMFYHYGFPRLRRVNPVEHYADMISHRFAPVRGAAATGLGDTADLAALTPLATALTDRSAVVRELAADSVRRLRHAGAAEQLPNHPVRRKLIDCLNDRKKAVRIAAARALAALGDRQTLRTHRARLSIISRRRRPEIDDVLRGDIPPLTKLWLGDETT